MSSKIDCTTFQDIPDAQEKYEDVKDAIRERLFELGCDADEDFVEACINDLLTQAFIGILH